MVKLHIYFLMIIAKFCTTCAISWLPTRQVYTPDTTWHYGEISNLFCSSLMSIEYISLTFHHCTIQIHQSTLKQHPSSHSHTDKYNVFP